jgi:hypothetical protein
MRLEIDPSNEFAELHFSSLAIACPDRQNRFSLDCSDPDDHEVLVLTHKRRGHHVTALASRLDVQWQLIFDAEDGDYLLLKLNGRPQEIAELIVGLPPLGFERLVDGAS